MRLNRQFIRTQLMAQNILNRMRLLHARIRLKIQQQCWNRHTAGLSHDLQMRESISSIILKPA